jgi:peptidoglycan/xylan/chitin deacetylase (PgdA/CDA1 family)
MKHTGLMALAVVLASIVVAAQSRPQPGTKLPLDQVSAQMFHVSAGKRLKPAAWPNGARVAVGLSFDVDNATADLATGNLISESISRGEYGAVDGLPRILRLLDKHQLPASFFIPAVSHLLHPDMIPAIMKSGRHEIGVHGWIHEHLPSVNDAAAEQDMLTRAIETLTKAIGKKPVGYRAPSWQFSQWTVKQVKDAGFLYDSSLMASDDAYEILLDQQATGVVELPIERILDDFPYFGGATNGGMPNPDLIEQVFRSEFDVAYDEGGLYILTMHPHITGHRSRVAGLEKLILHMKSKPGVWFGTHEQIARRQSERRQIVASRDHENTKRTKKHDEEEYFFFFVNFVLSWLDLRGAYFKSPRRSCRYISSASLMIRTASSGPSMSSTTTCLCSRTL